MNNGRIISIPNARIIFRNFSGEERKYNKKGDRNFNLVLTPEDAQNLSEQGFKVRERPPRDEDSDPQFFLPVSVNFENRPPKVLLITSRGKTELDEETVGELDYAELQNIDLSIRPYHWSMPNGSSGVKAYLNTLYATLVEDDFADKYDDLPIAER